jgi:hypothetical protein
MGETCYLCETGASAALATRLPAGEGFGTCRECSVHACPRHGDRSPLFFRCADCIAADAASAALIAPAETTASDVRGAAARLSAVSGATRERIQAARMGAAVAWLLKRIAEGDQLLIAAALSEGFGEQSPERLLAMPSLEPDERPDLAMEDSVMRAHLFEEELRQRVLPSLDSSMRWFADRERQNAAGEVATAGLAIAYAARALDDVERSPLEMTGGLTMPAVVVILGHAYSQANHYFW